jgi:hypothetical protein
MAKGKIENGNQVGFVENLDKSYFINYQWGAESKVNQLRTYYKLGPFDVSSSDLPENQTIEQTTKSSDWLDLQTVIKASQALLSEVQLEGLLKCMKMQESPVAPLF